MSELAVAIVDPFHPKIVEAIRAALPPGWHLRIAAGRRPEDHAAALAEADAAFVMATPMPAALLAQALRLGFIQKLGAGVDRIDLDYCAAHGIGVARLHAGNAVPVAEHTLLLMLAACRRLPLLDRQTRAGRWDKEDSRGVNRQIRGKTVGIVGFGAIGRAVARLLSGFEAKLAYYDPVPAPAETERALGVAPMPLDALIAASDILTLHLPLTPGTAGLIDAGRIARMKPGAILVNAARGGLVDEAALAAALSRGHLFAAALDTFSTEPPIGNPLLGLEQTVVTPHCAGATIDNFAALAERAVANTRTWLAGAALPTGDVAVAPRRNRK